MCPLSQCFQAFCQLRNLNPFTFPLLHSFSSSFLYEIPSKIPILVYNLSWKMQSFSYELHNIYALTSLIIRPIHISFTICSEGKQSIAFKYNMKCYRSLFSCVFYLFIYFNKPWKWSIE